MATKGGVAWETRARPPHLARGLGRLPEACPATAAWRPSAWTSIDLYQVHWPVAGVRRRRRRSARCSSCATRARCARSASRTTTSPTSRRRARSAQIDSFQPGYHLMRRDIEARRAAVVRRQRRRRDRLRPARPRPADREDDRRDDLRRRRLARAERAVRRRRVPRPHRRGRRAGRRSPARPGRAGGVAELAVAWVLRRPEVTAAIIGARDRRAGGAQRRARRPPARRRRGGRDRGGPRPPPGRVAPLRPRGAARIGHRTPER